MQIAAFAGASFYSLGLGLGKRGRRGIFQRIAGCRGRYLLPFEFTGRLLKVTVDMHADQKLDGGGVGAAEMARQ
ncbi:hypothetical protein [Bradyrhizobium sp. sGM-13]|uniref:hypothetical protein n=1 Tax=Bradyrhizobium sp. sGM-13 TaxID=2831781 RepID=UPI001BCC9BF1|nr:hypothetical protein [Bradyrhizobium sp. sGM-13]